MRSGQVKQLTVGGFQVFAEPISIPFGPLTLLYGPNSAGKSAIMDAIQALAGLCDLFAQSDPASAVDHTRPGRVLERHWRRGGGMPAVPSAQLQLGARVVVDADDWAAAGLAEQVFHEEGPTLAQERFEDTLAAVLPWLREHPSIEVEVRFVFKLGSDAAPPTGLEHFDGDHSVEIGLGGSPLLRWSAQPTFGRAEVNLRHPALHRRFATTDMKWMAGRYAPGWCSFVDGWFAISGCTLHASHLDVYELNEDVLPLSGRPTARDNEREQRLLRSFVSLFDAIWSTSLISARDTLRIPMVAASRTVPRKHEVTYLLDAVGNTLPDKSLGLKMGSLPQYEYLATSALRAELLRSEAIETEDGGVGAWIKHLERVNRLLSEYLFRQVGYFVAAEVYELTAPRSFVGQGALANSQSKPERRRFLVSLGLRDATDRHFDFDEVGSGLGYVLPVLMTMASSSVVFLQQPELHLHPALQAELADALVASLNESRGEDLQPGDAGNTQLIAETHSEHMLLRLLRRVRQSVEPGRVTDIHSLGREQLVVLYVDPRPDGTSTVKHLRVSKEGDFIDRWPRGFFEERWRELFDE